MQTWYRGRLRRVSSIIYGKSYYTNINELPAYNWFELNDNFNVDLLLKKPCKIKFLRNILIPEIWKNITNEYIDRFALTDEFLLILEKKKSIALKKLDKIITGDSSMQTLIEVEEMELDSLVNGKYKITYLEIKTMIEKYFSFHLDLKNISVAEFYTYLEIMKKQNGRASNKA